MRLDIILRTCDHSNVHNDWRVRYISKPKSEIIKGCVKSLFNSCKNIDDVFITILDDHSSNETINWLETELNNSKIPGKIIKLEEKGYNYSSHEQWKLCRDSNADLVYSVEDDYLHSPSAIREMIDSFKLFSQRLKNNDIVIYPFDDPSEYNPPNRKDFIVHGSARHWRTGIFTTNVLFCKPKIFKEYWALFETLALKYNGDYLNPRSEHYEESNTIWKIWTEGNVIRFNPIPSLALHLQFIEQQDPFIDWEKWWGEYTR
jgi:hypothetical protein